MMTLNVPVIDLLAVGFSISSFNVCFLYISDEQQESKENGQVCDIYSKKIEYIHLCIDEGIM